MEFRSAKRLAWLGGISVTGVLLWVTWFPLGEVLPLWARALASALSAAVGVLGFFFLVELLYVPEFAKCPNCGRRLQRRVDFSHYSDEVYGAGKVIRRTNPVNIDSCRKCGYTRKELAS